MNINLMKRKLYTKKVFKTPSARRSMSKASSSSNDKGNVWYIAKKHNDKTYYVHEVDKKSGTVKWTSSRNKAMVFRTENGVHHFLHTYMNDRTDIYLINAPEKKK